MRLILCALTGAATLGLAAANGPSALAEPFGAGGVAAGGLPRLLHDAHWPGPHWRWRHWRGYRYGYGPYWRHWHGPRYGSHRHGHGHRWKRGERGERWDRRGPDAPTRRGGRGDGRGPRGS